MEKKLVHFTERQIEILDIQSKRLGINSSELIRRIIDEKIEAEKWKRR